MANKIDLKELKIDELLERVNETVEEESLNIDVNRHVQSFVLDYKILPGTDFIPNYLIYYEYRRVWRAESRSKLTKIEFFRNFSKMFDSKRKNIQRGYLLNKESFNLSEVRVELSKDSDKIYENKIKRKREEKKQKKHDKIS